MENPARVVLMVILMLLALGVVRGKFVAGSTGGPPRGGVLPQLTYFAAIVSLLAATGLQAWGPDEWRSTSAIFATAVFLLHVIIANVAGKNAGSADRL